MAQTEGDLHPSDVNGMQKILTEKEKKCIVPLLSSKKPLQVRNVAEHSGDYGIEKRLDTVLLLSFYSPLLTEKQQKAMHLYYDEDYSLSEIAQEMGISRQGIFDAIHRGEEQISLLEERLGLLKRWTQICDGLRECKNAIEAGNMSRASEIIDSLLTEEEGTDGV